MNGQVAEEDRGEDSKVRFFEVGDGSEVSRIHHQTTYHHH